MSIQDNATKPWRVRLVCCGRDCGFQYADTWDEADKFREGYCTETGAEPHGYGGRGFGHRRAGIIERNEDFDHWLFVALSSLAADIERRRGQR